jgi:hypothetical protein
MKFFAQSIVFGLLSSLLLSACAVGLPGEEFSERGQFEKMKKVEVENAVELGAVCNDSSPAVYYSRPGGGEDVDKWLVFLGGGGGCEDEASCRAQWQSEPERMSSDRYKATRTADGILSTKAKVNPDFYNFNHVYVPLCSSDGWAGDSEVTYGDLNLQFRGKRIIEAIFKQIDFSDSSELLFAGSSGGGQGVLQNLDFVAGLVPEIEVKGIVDASWKRPTPHYVNGEIYSFGTRYELHDAVLDASCVENEPDPLSCFDLNTAYKYIDSDVFFSLDLIDSKDINQIGISDREEPGQKAYIEAYGESGVRALAKLNNVFAYVLGAHTALTNERFYQVEVDGVTLSETIGNWYFGRQGLTRAVLGD